MTAAYYRKRFFTKEAMAALAKQPTALKLVEGVRGVLDAYLAEETARVTSSQ